MQEIVGNLWSYWRRDGFVVLITTNGFVKKTGRLVMGRGCAREALDRISNLDLLLGKAVTRKGNKILQVQDPVSKLYYPLMTFPVKHNWWQKADLDLIKKSARHLSRIATPNGRTNFILPRPGCGNGQLSWPEVRPLLTSLPDNVWIISKRPQ